MGGSYACFKTRAFRCWAFSSKTHRFENAVGSELKQKRINIVLLWAVENASKWKRWPKISQARVFVACAQSSTYVTTSNSIVFEQWGQSKTHQSGSVDENRILIENSYFWKRISVDRAAFIQVRVIDSCPGATNALYCLFAGLLEFHGAQYSPSWQSASSDPSKHSAFPLQTCSFFIKAPFVHWNNPFEFLSWKKTKL